MENEKKNKQELLEQIKKLADKHADLKEIITSMLDEMDKNKLEINKNMDLKEAITSMLSEMDKIESEYNKIKEEIKKN